MKTPSRRPLNQTGPLGRNNAPREMNVSPQVSFSERATTAPTHLLFQIAQDDGSTISIGVEVKSKLVIGRSDPSSQTPADVDLSQFNAQNMGVSREHAFIVHQGDKLCLQDNHSRNNSYLNGKKVEPDEDYPLKDGDNLEFGRLHVTLYFITE